MAFPKMAELFGEPIFYLPADGAQPPTRLELSNVPISEEMLPIGLLEDGGESVFRIMVPKSDVAVVREDEDRVERDGDVYRVSRIVNDTGEVWELELV